MRPWIGCPGSFSGPDTGGLLVPPPPARLADFILSRITLQNPISRREKPLATRKAVGSWHGKRQQSQEQLCKSTSKIKIHFNLTSTSRGCLLLRSFSLSPPSKGHAARQPLNTPYARYIKTLLTPCAGNWSADHNE